jgi:hypothetical protein
VQLAAQDMQPSTLVALVQYIDTIPNAWVGKRFFFLSLLKRMVAAAPRRVGMVAPLANNSGVIISANALQMQLVTNLRPFARWLFILQRFAALRSVDLRHFSATT